MGPLYEMLVSMYEMNLAPPEQTALGKVWYTQMGSSYSGVWDVMGVSGIYPTFAAGNVKRCAR